MPSRSDFANRLLECEPRLQVHVEVDRRNVASCGLGDLSGNLVIDRLYSRLCDIRQRPNPQIAEMVWRTVQRERAAF